MKKSILRLTDPVQSRRVTLGVRAWQKRAKVRRIPLKKLAENLKITLSQARTAVKKPHKRLRRAEERIKLRKAVKARAKKTMKREIGKETATKISRELQLKTVSEKAAQRIRKPERDKIQAWIRAEKAKRSEEADEYARVTQLPVDHPDYFPSTSPRCWRWTR